MARALDAPQSSDLPLFRALDDIEISEPAWRAVISRVLLHFVSRLSQEDLAVLVNLNAFCRAHRGSLQELSLTGRLEHIEKITHVHPVAAAFLRRDHLQRVSPGLDLLLALLTEFSLSAELTERANRVTLASALRGALAGGPLQMILGGATSLAELQQVMADHLASSNRGVRPEFEGLWRTWLRGKLWRMVAERAGRLRETIQLPPLGPDLDAPFVPVDNNLAGEPDDVTQIGVAVVEPSEPGGGNRCDVPRSVAASLLRASEGDVLTPDDYWVPEDVTIRLAQAAVAAAERHQAAGRIEESEPLVALAFALATGVREIDLRKVTWGNIGFDTFPLEVDPSASVLYRHVYQPPNAYQPSGDIASCLRPSTHVLDWPLPPTLHRLLQGLDKNRNASDPVFSHLAQSIVGYRLRDQVKILDPSIALGAGVFRMALASRIARQLGSDAAQLALGDNFAVSTGPAYYSAVRESDLRALVCQLHARWFNEATALPASERTFGSQLVLRDESAQCWSADLLRHRRSSVRRKGDNAIDEWVAHRNLLAGSLCAATGHRPINAIGAIRLDDVIPEYGLIILKDKEVDALHANRIAATGALWLSELRLYLDRLVEASKRTDLPHAAELASAILRSEKPLFDVPDPNGTTSFSYTAATLRASMPMPLRDAANHYRHRLNQCLQWRGVDPELRHWQLGWITSPAYATSSMSPASPRDLAKELGSILDEVMLADGWFPQTRRTPAWSWDGVPERPLKDWRAITKAHEEEHQARVADLRTRLREEGKAAEVVVLQRLAAAIHKTIPGLVLNEESRRLVLAPDWTDQRFLISHDICALILDRVRMGDEQRASAVEGAVARMLLYRLLRASHRAGLTKGALPRWSIYRYTTASSPFLPGLGLAVRHAEQLRHIVLSRAGEGSKRDLGILALLSVVLHSPYRALDWAKAAVESAKSIVRGQQPGDTVRIPAKLNRKQFPMVLGGIAALLVARRGQQAKTAHAPTNVQIIRWLKIHFGSDVITINDVADLDRVVESALAAGLVEVSGQERLLMTRKVELTCVPVARALAASDDWPVQTAEKVLIESEAMRVGVDAPSVLPAPQRAQASEYRKLTALLNPDLFNAGKKSDSRFNWRHKLASALESLSKEVGLRTTVGLLTDYGLHRLRYGGAKVKHLQQKSLQTDITRFGRSLVDVAGSRSPLDMDSEELHQIYLAVLVRKSDEIKPLVVEALWPFHRYLEEVHGAPAVSFSELAALAGSRVDRVDAGLLTNPEVSAIFDVLQRDISSEESRIDSSPEFHRLATLRLLMFLLLEASGARPASIYGLQLGDLHLFDEGRDFIHIHRTGGYGAAKTDSAIGFVQLEGSLWARARPWVCTFLVDEKSHSTSEPNLPLFARERGTRLRFDRADLEERLGALAKWASNEPRGKQYWLRKTRILSRHARAGAQRPARARDVHGVLCASGQATIETPLASYVADAAVPLTHSLREGREASRADLIAVTQLAPVMLDMAWQRANGPDAKDRLTITLRQARVMACDPPAGKYTEPPPLRRSLELRPMHVDAFARAYQKTKSIAAACKSAGLTSKQAARLQEIATELSLLRGQAPWKTPSLRFARYVIKPARRFAGTEKILAVLGETPSLELERLANAWAASGHARRVTNERAGLVFADSESAVAAQQTMTTLAGTAAVVAELVEENSIYLLHIRPAEKKSRRSVMNALNWVMAITWIHGRLK